MPDATIIIPGLSGRKKVMQKIILCFVALFFSFASCKKDKDMSGTGVVNVKGGCFPDSWLVAIDNPDPKVHPFLRATTSPTSVVYNCSNAVYIRLPASLAVAGTRVRFSWINIEGSCLSYSEAPNHIAVKNLSRL